MDDKSSLPKQPESSQPESHLDSSAQVKVKKSTEGTATVRLTLCAVYVALICVCSLTSIPTPFSPVSFTLGLFAVLFFPALSSDGIKSVIIFILMGLIGIPVFSNFAATDALVGPTGGFILGYIPAALISCAASHLAFKNRKKSLKSVDEESVGDKPVGGKKNRTDKKVTTKINNAKKAAILTAGLLLAVAVCYLFGMLWFMYHMQVSFKYAFDKCVLLFIPFDCAKVVLTVLLTLRLRPLAQSIIKRGN